MKKYKENMESKDEVFEQRKQEAIKSTSTKSDVDDISAQMEKTDPWSERQNVENEVL